MKDMFKKVISITMILLMMGMVFVSTNVNASEEVEEDVTEEIENDVAEETLETVPATDISQIKINTKIKFTGTLYKVSIPTISQILNRETSTEMVAKGTYTDQVAIVMSLMKKSQNMILVGFFPEGKEVPVMGYIKMDENTTIGISTQKYINISLDLTNIKNGAAIVIDGEKYDLSAEISNVDISNGAVNIGGNVVLVRERLELVNYDGNLNLDIGNKTAGGTSSVEVMEKINVAGDASITLEEDGVSVSGDANVNGTEIGSGTAKVSYTGESDDPIAVEVSNASVAGNDFTAIANSLINTVMKIIKQIIAKLIALFQ